mmetsp:Transcript_6752/g.12280  ORF Transcript_6752/g.12280 Transcript_6752/m.12280 type:complete len:310 (-) Transcript_6752:99-1028(-)
MKSTSRPLAALIFVVTFAPTAAVLRGSGAAQEEPQSSGPPGERQSVLKTQATAGGNFLQLAGGLTRRTQETSAPMWIMYFLLAVLVPSVLSLTCLSLASRVNTPQATATALPFPAAHPRSNHPTGAATAPACAPGNVPTYGATRSAGPVTPRRPNFQPTPYPAAEQFAAMDNGGPAAPTRPSFRPAPTSPCEQFAPFDDGGNPEVTQYRAWEDPTAPEQGAETQIDEKERETVVVNFNSPPIFHLPAADPPMAENLYSGVRPQTMKPLGSPSWTTPGLDSGFYDEYLDKVHQAMGRGKTTSLLQTRARS